MLFQAFLFVLTAYRFYGTLKAGWGDVPLMLLLMRDGTWAFFLLFCEPTMSGCVVLEFLTRSPSHLLGLYNSFGCSTSLLLRRSLCVCLIIFTASPNIDNDVFQLATGSILIRGKFPAILTGNIIDFDQTGL